MLFAVISHEQFLLYLFVSERLFCHDATLLVNINTSCSQKLNTIYLHGFCTITALFYFLMNEFIPKTILFCGYGNGHTDVHCSQLILMCEVEFFDTTLFRYNCHLLLVELQLRRGAVLPAELKLSLHQRRRRML